MEALQEGTSAMYSNMPTLSAGISQLSNGSATLVSKNGALKDGAGKLSNATVQVCDGVGKLEDGSQKLTDGMAQFDEEGIQKLTDAYHGDVKTLLDRLEAVNLAGKSYQSFTKLGKGTTGSVKFILRTEGIKTEDNE